MYRPTLPASAFEAQIGKLWPIVWHSKVKGKIENIHKTSKTTDRNHILINCGNP